MSAADRFADGKAPDALRTIGEVASALGIRQHVLRYWEEQFPMLRPLKRSGGRRYYRTDDIALVERIDRLVHHEGYTLRGARLALEGGGTAPDLGAAPTFEAPPSSVAEEPSFGLRARLLALRHSLATALQDA
jgi:DNA-binding transcriptional MerR regulator